MKLISILVSLVLLTQGFNFKVTKSPIKRLGRTLTDSTETANQILADEAQISIDEIKDRIIDMHKNIKLCIDNEFDKDPSEVLEFSEIV